MIVFDNVTKYYKSNVGLEKGSVHSNKGDFVFLVGPSGAGKDVYKRQGIYTKRGAGAAVQHGPQAGSAGHR